MTLLGQNLDGVQLLVAALFSLPIQSPPEGPLGKLPASTTQLPRVKPLPKPKPSTKWESSLAQRVYSLGDMIGKYGTKSARRGWRAGDGGERIRPRRRSGCTRFPLALVCFFLRISLPPFFGRGSTEKPVIPMMDPIVWTMTRRRKLVQHAKLV